MKNEVINSSVEIAQDLCLTMNLIAMWLAISASHDRIVQRPRVKVKFKVQKFELEIKQA